MYEFKTPTEKTVNSVHVRYWSDVITDYLDENDLRLFSPVVYVIHKAGEKYTLIVRVWQEPGVSYVPLRLHFTRCGSMMLFNFDATKKDRSYAMKYEKVRV